jgi:hypothetical protein
MSFRAALEEIREALEIAAVDPSLIYCFED